MSGAYSIGWKGLLLVRRSGPWGGNYVDNGRVSSTCSVGYESIKTISTGRAVPNLVLETNKLQLWFPKISLIPGFFPPDFRTLITGEVVTHHTSNVGVVKHLRRVLFFATGVAGSLFLRQPFLCENAVNHFFTLA